MFTNRLFYLLIVAVVIAAVPFRASAQTGLNPPPPFWYTCKTTGSRTVCHGKMSFDDFGGFDGTCPQGFDILENSHKDETGARYYDRNGNLIKRVLHDIFPVGDPLNILYNSRDRKSVAASGDITETDDFGVPG